LAFRLRLARTSLNKEATEGVRLLESSNQQWRFLMRKILALALVAAFGALVACNKSEEAKPATDSTLTSDTAAKVDTAVKADTTKKDSAAAPKADSAKK